MNSKNYDLPLMFINLIIIIIFVILLAAFPERGTDAINAIFSVVTDTLGSFILWFGFLTFAYSCYMAFSKYGNIKLGEEKPEFSLFQYLAMMICAGLGSACVIWSFVEWAYYYSGPALGVEALSADAAEWATAYNMFHWGFTPWAMFVVLAIPVSYAFHVRKIPALRFQNICQEMIGEKPYARPVSILVDYFFVFCVVGGLSVTLGLGVPVIAAGVCAIFGGTATFATNVAVTIAIAVLFSLSSYIGIEKGMKRLSSFNVYAAIVFIAALLIAGPTHFILAQITDGFGLMIQNYIRMSFWTDPINQGGFPEAWTIFFYAFGIVYATLMALFITKISKGRTLRQMICCVMFGGGFGCFIFFGINGSYSMSLQLNGTFDVVSSLFNQGNAATILSIIGFTPFGVIGIIAFVIILALFLATTLDSAAFSLSAASTKHLTNTENTSPTLRLFWCVTLALTPLCMNFVGASLSNLQTLTIVTSVPFIFVIICMTKGLFTWLKQDGYR